MQQWKRLGDIGDSLSNQVIERLDITDSETSDRWNSAHKIRNIFILEETKVTQAEGGWIKSTQPHSIF